MNVLGLTHHHIVIVFNNFVLQNLLVEFLVGNLKLTTITMDISDRNALIINYRFNHVLTTSSKTAKDGQIRKTNYIQI